MEQVSNLVNNLLCRVCPTLPLGIAINREWREIVGDEMAQFSSFSEVKFCMNDAICIVVNVLNSASMLFRYNSTEINDKLSKLTGYSADKISLVIKQISNNDAEYQDAA